MSRDIEQLFEPMTVADVFCGAGGLSEGFRKAMTPKGSPAFDVVFGVDRDPDCMATYRRNILVGSEEDRRRRGPCRTVVGLRGADILDAAQVDRIDVLVGGPNCQAVSSAGRRNLDDSRNAMFEEYARLVDELRPRWFVMENVPGLTHANGLPLLAEIFDRFEKLGAYEVAGDVLLAADHGAAQYRYRLVLIGTRTDHSIRLPAQSHFSDRPPFHRSVRDAIGHLDQAPWKEPGDNVALDLNVRRMMTVPAGGDWRDIPIELLPDRSFAVRTSDQKGAYGRLEWDKPAFTVTGLAGNMTAGPFTHPDHHRVLTAKEAAALQGFRPDFAFDGSAHSRYRQIGNAVPPHMAKAVAEAIVRVELDEASGLSTPRLTSDVVVAAKLGTKRLPVMTPRLTARAFVKPSAGRLPRPRETRRPRVAIEPKAMRPNGTVMIRLRAEAALPMYSWTAKRAKAILGALDGQSYEDLAGELKISVQAAERWVEEFSQDGAEGWRAYHTSLDHLIDGDPDLRAKVKAAIEQVRRPTLVAEVRQGKARAHMNRYLRTLVQRFRGASVNSLRGRLAAQGFPTGTMYVGDLLAMADVLLPVEEQLEPVVESAAEVSNG